MANQPSSTRASRSQEGSYLAAGTVLEGKMAFTGPTIVSAHLKGDISTDSLLVVEAGAVIEGNVSGSHIVVHGQVKGSVSASEGIEAWPGCRLEGRAYAPSMRIDEGANVFADLVIAPNRPADWLTQAEPAPVPSPVAPAAAPLEPHVSPMPAASREPLPTFTNTMFSAPAKTGSGN